MEARILAFAVLVLIAVVLLFGVAPALAATRLDLSRMFHGSGTAARRTAQNARLGSLLVVAQVAICSVLLSGAVLFARTLQTLTGVDAGFRPENVLLLGVRSDGDLNARERMRLYQQVIERLTHVPGVQSVALSTERLFGGNSWSEPISGVDPMTSLRRE